MQPSIGVTSNRFKRLEPPFPPFYWSGTIDISGFRATNTSPPLNCRLVTPLDLLATVYHTLGIPLETHYEDASGRPASIVGSGRLIQELL